MNVNARLDFRFPIISTVSVGHLDIFLHPRPDRPIFSNTGLQQGLRAIFSTVGQFWLHLCDCFHGEERARPLNGPGQYSAHPGREV